jgi:hypothetical protein
VTVRPRWRPGRTFGPGLALGGASLALVGAAAVWARSGDRARNSFALVRLARRLEVVPDALAPLAVAWFLLPVLVGVAWLCFGLGRSRATSAISATAGALALGGVAAVAASPLRLEVGAGVTAAGGALALLGALVSALGPRDR